MFNLISNPDQQIVLNGTEYTVNDSFDNIIIMFDKMKQTENNMIAVYTAINALLGEIPDLPFKYIAELYSRLYSLYIGDKDENTVYDLQGNPLPAVAKEWFSFKYDAELIYSAFIQAYHIDLHQEAGKMRWLTFRALMAGLPNDTQFKRVVELRQRPYPTGKGTSKERAVLREIKEKLSYPGSDFT